MLKRKRGDHMTQDGSEGPAVPPTTTTAGSQSQQQQQQQQQRQQRQLASALAHGQTAISRALKVSRGFERQKLGRRTKGARAAGDEAELGRLGAEVSALKALDLAAVAELHLHKSLLRVRAVVAASAFPNRLAPRVGGLGGGPLDVACANVTARLYDSDPVKAAVAEAMATVRGILGIVEAKVGSKKRLRAADYKALGETPGSSQVVAPPGGEAVVAAGSRRQGSEAVGREDLVHSKLDGGGDTDRGEKEGDGEKDVENATKSDDEDSSDFGNTRYTSRLADISDEGDQEGSDSTSNGTFIKPRESSFGPANGTSVLLPTTAVEQRKTISKPLPTRPITTTFLPSLSMGGYWSGSDSAADSDSNPSLETKPHKNRRGQKARQQLWEKKFGHKANHLKKQSRDQGWDPRKGAQGGDARGSRARGRGVRSSGGKGGGGGQRITGANGDPVVVRADRKRANEAEGPLHPSWEAAKKRKKQKAVVAFAGKKVVFD